MRRTFIRRMAAFTAGLFAVALAVAPAAPAAAEPPAAKKTLADAPAVASAVKLLESWIASRMEYDRLPGLSIAIVYDQKLVYSRGFGWADHEAGIPAGPRTLYRAASITKLFTATALLRLRDAGRLRLDDPVSKYLPWFKIQSPFPGRQEITVWNLLTHTSGLPGEAAFPYWTDHVFPSREEIIKALPGQQLVFRPETRYKYSNLGLALAGEVVTAASGEPYTEYVREHVLEPLGMRDSSVALPEERMKKLARGYSRLLPDGTRTVLPVADYKGMTPAANLTTTVEDLARFMMLQFRDGEAGGSQVLSGRTLREMQRVHWVFPSWTGGRGLGFIIRRSEGRTVVGHGGWVGGFRSQLGFVPEDKVGVVVMINADDGTPNLFLERALDIVGKALVDAARPAKPAAGTDPAWKRYVGLYTDTTFWETEVLILDGRLVMYGHAYPPEDDPRSTLIELEPVSKHVFRSGGPNGDGEPVRFELGPDGKVVRVKVGENYLYPKK